MNIVKVDDLTIDLNAKTVNVGDRRIQLTGKEYQMLELLALRKGVVISKTMFLDYLYAGERSEPDPKIIDVFICKVRKKLAGDSEDKNYINTVWGRGYVLGEVQQDAQPAASA